MGLIHTVRSIRVLTKRALVLLEVVSCSPEASTNYPHIGQGSAPEKPICRTPEGSCISDETYSSGLFRIISCRESILPGAQCVSGSPSSTSAMAE